MVDPSGHTVQCSGLVMFRGPQDRCPEAGRGIKGVVTNATARLRGETFMGSPLPGIVPSAGGSTLLARVPSRPGRLPVSTPSAPASELPRTDRATPLRRCCQPFRGRGAPRPIRSLRRSLPARGRPPGHLDRCRQPRQQDDRRRPACLPGHVRRGPRPGANVVEIDLLFQGQPRRSCAGGVASVGLCRHRDARAQPDRLEIYAAAFPLPRFRVPLADGDRDAVLDAHTVVADACERGGFVAPAVAAHDPAARAHPGTTRGRMPCPGPPGSVHRPWSRHRLPCPRGSCSLTKPSQSRPITCGKVRGVQPDATRSTGIARSLSCSGRPAPAAKQLSISLSLPSFAGAELQVCYAWRCRITTRTPGPAVPPRRGHPIHGSGGAP